MPTAYGYCRESTDKQLMGLDAQQEAIEGYYRQRLASTHTWGGFYVDAKTTGKISFADRPKGRELNGRAERGDAIILAKLDRGFRRIANAVNMVEAWTERGVVLCAIDLGMDTANHVGRLFLHMLAAFAEFERARIIERTADVKARMKREGRQLNGFAGYGFKWAGVKGKRKRVPDQEERAVMRWIIAQKEANYTWTDMRELLLRQKVLTTKGTEWTVSRIRRAYLAGCALFKQENGSSLDSSSAARTPALDSTAMALPTAQLTTNS